MPKICTYTPAPLSLQQMHSGYRILGGPRLSIVAEVHETSAHNAEPNALLFAAAPDLLAAALECERYFAATAERYTQSGCDVPPHVVKPLELLSSAIAKATLSPDDRARIKANVVSSISGLAGEES